MHPKNYTWLCLAAMSALVGCADAANEPAIDSNYAFVAPGKADDYYSTVAKEYEATGSIRVQMSPDQAADAKERDRIVAERLSAAGVYLATYLSDKFRGIDINADGQITDDEVFFRNDTYGGFHAMVRNQSVEVLSIDDRGGEFEVTFSIDIAGPAGLLELLVADGGAAVDGGVVFDLRMPAGATGSADGRPIRTFDPNTYSGELETVALNVVQHADVSDAYPAYRDFMSDNVYDITMFYGHDYNAGRYDLVDAREGYDVLLALGYTSPVATFEQLTPQSGPFIKEIQVPRLASDDCADLEALALLNDRLTTEADLKAAGLRSDAARNTIAHRAGRDGVFGTRDDVRFYTMADFDAVYRVGPATIAALRNSRADVCRSNTRTVRVEVRLFHSDMFASDRAGQREAVFNELVTRDVFFYNGHAGPYYGFYLDENYEAYIDDSEFAALPFDARRQQMFVAQGCQTYSQYADMLYANPNRDESNLDVITTVNYSYSQGTMNLFQRLTFVWEGMHYAFSYRDLVGGLNNEYWNDQKAVFYGVMGIDQNDKLYPWADLTTTGETCTQHADCGATTDGNLCMGLSDGRSVCMVRTVAESGCPQDTSFAYISEEDTLVGGVCWK
ncbi:MAG: hypothetical protein R3E66_15490 [bacterium]